MSVPVSRLFINVFVTKCKTLSKNFSTFPSSPNRNKFFTKDVKMDELSLSLMCRQLAPPLNSNRYKGQAGRIAIFGGSLEYTGAPYFSAITSLRVGADLVHVFCAKDAGVVIKSYSPELIVHPVLDDGDAIGKITPWLDRFHVILIGPGLGREESTFKVIGELIDICRTRQKAIVIDADGLFYIAKNKDKLNCYPSPGAVLTPNAMEFARLLGSDNPSTVDDNKISELFSEWGDNVTILVKGAEDKIMDKSRKIKAPPGGSGRRCGGQGDLLGGALCTFFAWALQHKIDVDVPHDDRPFLACYAACKLVKECNARSFKKFGRSMVATDMIQEVHEVFDEFFEQK